MPIPYAGPEPGQAPGIYQINAQIPELASTGNVQFTLGQDLGQGAFGAFQYYTLSYLYIAVK